MPRFRQYLVATCTFSVALGIGFVMQNGDVLASRFSEPQRPAVTPLQTAVGFKATIATVPTQPGLAVAAAESGAVTVQAIPMPDAATETAVTAVELADEVGQPAMALPELTGYDLTLPAMDAGTPSSGVSVASATPPVLLAAVTTDYQELPQLEEPLAMASGCSVAMTAITTAAAMVDLAVTAPCSPETRVTIHHQGMMFSMLTGPDGTARVSVPALAENAVFIADLGNGEGSVAVTAVPELNSFDRAVLQWQGNAGPEIHALEYGATYSDNGHVWHGAARSPDVALSGMGGFLVRLGDGAGLSPMMAEVYTFPSGQSRQAGTVAFTVETPVTDVNCGSQIQAQTIQVSPGADAFAQNLSLTVPDCSAVGEFLVLRNMLLDLTLAAK